MARDYFDLMREALSQERLEAYRRKQEDSDIDLVSRYLWNINLSESLYPLLHGLEIALRNQVHQQATKHFQTDLWFDNPQILDFRGQKLIADARQKLSKQGKSTSDTGRIISELTFGFWTSLFDVRYEKTLVIPLIKQTFPYLPRKIRTRSTISKRLNLIRQLRNRIFHHEPIWHWKDLKQQHTQLLEAIGWLNPALRDTFQLVADRFPAVYHQGVDPHREYLQGFIRGFKDSY